MSIQTYLENMRAKPEHERKRTALWMSFGITAVITLFWIASFTGINIGSVGAQSAVSDAVARAGSPAQSMIAGVGGFAGDIWSMITGPKKVTYATIEVSPGPGKR